MPFWHIPVIQATVYGVGFGLVVGVAILVWLTWRVARHENRFGPRRTVRPHLTVVRGGNSEKRELKARPRVRRERRRRSGSQ